MARFKRTLIALDLSKNDATMLRTVANLVRHLEIEVIYLLHVMPDFTKPMNMDVEFYKLFNPDYPVDEKVRDKLKMDFEEIFKPEKPLESNADVLEGKPFEKLIHWIEIKLIDLLVVGQKKVSLGSGITAKRVARATKTNILYIPENQSGVIRRILVPLDYSKEGVNALRTALDLSYSIGNVEVTALHVIPQPSAIFYDPTWEYGAFQQALRTSAKHSFDLFINENGFEGHRLNAVFLDDDYNSISRHIHEYSVENHTDLIVMGAMGHTALNNLIFGSVTESLVERCKEKMILVTR
jgi:nucleotide-binding universal stress UspA family protein